VEVETAGGCVEDVPLVLPPGGGGGGRLEVAGGVGAVAERVALCAKT
jgi:hypothetical protein